jgi:hypothetical protein
MNNLFFLAGLGIPLGLLLRWSFAALPGESWQMLAAVPRGKQASGQWQGLNLTYYGFFTANAYLAAVALCLVLLGAVGIPAWCTGLLAVAVLLVCVPASRLVARIVEGKRHTFTVAGAYFAGVIAAPLLLSGENVLLDRLGQPRMPLVPTLAAAVIAYVLGEGIGRLACMSFGCCYGKPLSQCPPWLQRLCAGREFVFSGPTKKAVYEGQLSGMQLVPVQALTATLLIVTTLAGVAMFLTGCYRAALLTGIVVPQVWRWSSEFLRADFRGNRRISAYQVMALASVAYCGLLAMLLSDSTTVSVDVVAGLKLLWDPALILGMQLLWVVLFLFTGRSEVTGSTLSFHVRQDRI